LISNEFNDINLMKLFTKGHGLVSGSGGHDWSGPRFQNDFPHEVAFTPERGSTLDCMAHGQPAPHVTWLTSSSSKGELMFSFPVLAALIQFRSVSSPPARKQANRKEIRTNLVSAE